MITAILCAAVGALLYRLRGGPTWLPAPRWLKLALCASLLAAGAFWQVAGTFEPVGLLIALLGFLWAFYGLSRAHGSYYDLGHNGAGTETDWLWLERWLAGVRWLPLREGLLLAVTGLAATLGPGLALVLLGEWRGVVLAASGLLKAPAYAIGWRFWRRAPTEAGEWLTGAAMGLGVGAGFA